MISETYPCGAGDRNTQEHLVIEPAYSDRVTGSLWVHQDLVKVRDDWAIEQHIAPPSGSLRFGEVASWVEYVMRYGNSGSLLTWNASGLRAELDHHTANNEAITPGRCQWTAVHPFEPSLQWKAWTALASGQALSQRQAIERLEDLAEDIREPAQTDLMALLRSLRASVNAKADTEFRPDGTTSIRFAKDASVKSGAEGSVDLPSEIGIAIPVLKGHVDEQGRPVVYRLAVRVRVSVDDNAHLAFRFTIPAAERVLESVYADRVNAAKALLGESYSLLRAAD